MILVYSLLISALLIMLLFCIRNKRIEGLENKPNDEERAQYIEEILKNKKVFNKSLKEAKKKIPWMDAVIYEEIRFLIHNSSLNKESLSSLFA